MTEEEYKKDLKGELLRYRSTLDLPKEVTFGIEIEYENIVKDTFSYFLDCEKSYYPSLVGWENKSEIHIEEYNKNNEIVNGEVVSPILRDKISTWQNLRYVLRLLNNKGAIVTEKCGGHINVGTHILVNNPNMWQNFILLWILYEKEIYKFSSGDFKKVRIDKDGYFKRLKNEFDFQTLSKLKNKEYLQKLMECIVGKNYCVFVSKNFSKKFLNGNRIEFRIPNSSLSEEIWQNYINFFTKFVLSCKKDLDKEKIIYNINNDIHSPLDLVNYVFESEIDKEYFLIQTLKTNKIYKKELPKHIVYY